MRDKIVLIDGHSILNRAFYGLPDLTNAAGRHTNAVYGFLNILFKILDEEKPQYLAVAFDLSAPTFRHKLYPEYKGTRHEMPSELREQIPLAKETLTAMGVPVFSLEGYEADDILGTVARVASEAGLDVRVISGDRDLLQLATDRVMIRIPKTKAGGTLIEDYHDSDVLETMGVRADQIVDLKALMGDSSDNIPGIPGVGVKTATKIISEHGSIEAAHDHIEEISPKRAQESLRDHWDLAVLSKELAKIDTQVPMEINLDAAKLSDLYTPEAYAIFRELEFKNFFNRFDPDAAVAKSDFTVPVVMTEDEARA